MGLLDEKGEFAINCEPTKQEGTKVVGVCVVTKRDARGNDIEIRKAEFAYDKASGKVELGGIRSVSNTEEGTVKDFGKAMHDAIRAKF